VKNLTPAKMTLLMFAVVGVLVAAYVLKTVFAVEEPPQTRNVPMALTKLEPGTRISAGDIGLGPWPVDQLQPDVIASREVLVGRIVKETIEPARPIRSSQLYPAGEFPPLRVEPGMRAVTVDIEDAVEAVGGLIKPGEYVDVHWTVDQVRNDDRLQNGLTLTLFRGVRVLAVHRPLRQSNDDQNSNAVTPPRAVTLELTPEQANVLILARQKGRITLTYNPDGKGEGVVEVPDENRATFYEILGMSPPQEPEEEPEPQPFRSEIYRRSTRQILEFPEGQPSRVVGGDAAPTRRPGRGDTARPAGGSGSSNAAPPLPEKAPAAAVPVAPKGPTT